MHLKGFSCRKVDGRFFMRRCWSMDGWILHRGMYTKHILSYTSVE